MGIDLDIIDRIERVRGPGSALYGTGAMFAVINIITQKGNRLNGFKLATETDSCGKLQGAAAFGKEWDNGMDVSISSLWGDIKGQDLYFPEYDAPSTNHGIAEGLDWDKYSTVGGATTPRAAVVYNPITSGTLKLLYGEAFRAPNIFKVNDEDEFAGYKPNPDLKPEKIRTTEVVWEQRLGSGLFGIVSLYHYDMKNLIDQTIAPSDSLVQFQNISQVKANGLELELNAHLKTGIEGH